MQNTLSNIAFFCILLFITACAPNTREAKQFFIDPTRAMQKDKVKSIENVLTEDSLRREGVCKYYYPTGKLKLEINYKAGKPWEVVSAFDIEGKKTTENTLKEGKGALYLYDEFGGLTSVQNYKEGIPHGKTEVYGLSKNVVGNYIYRYGELADNFGGSSQDASETATSDTTASDKGNTNSGSGAFDVSITNNIVKAMQAGKYQEIYANSHSGYKKTLTAENFNAYLSTLKSFYGDIKVYQSEQYNLAAKQGMGEVVEIAYTCRFAYCKGVIIFNLFKENNKFKLANVMVQTENYTPIMQITRVGNPVLENLKNNKYDDIYKNASELFRSKIGDKSKYDQMMSQFRTLGDISTFQLYQHQVGVIEGKLIVQAIYETKIAGKDIPVNLLLLQQGKDFVLGGLSIGGN